jgi:hypothetical protein
MMLSITKIHRIRKELRRYGSGAQIPMGCMKEQDNEELQCLFKHIVEMVGP